MAPDHIERNELGYYLPKTESDIVRLVEAAKSERKQIRVRGSGHSVGKAIFTDGFRQRYTKAGNYNLLLDLYNQIVSIDKKKKQVTVQAGCHLSIDPFNITGNSTVQNGLLWQIDQLGWALNDLGGITHQTVGGFLATGSSGGSTTYGIEQNIVALKLIDGNGNIVHCSNTKNRDIFSAAGVSMGLLGIISEVTFQCTDRYDIIGQEAIYHIADSAVDLFGPGSKSKPSLEKFLKDTEYTRLMWWPQKGVEKIVIWQARRMKKKDYSVETNPPAGPGKSHFKPKPYEEMGDHPWLAEFGAGLFYRILGNLNKLGFIGRIINKYLGKILPAVLNLFVEADSDKKPPNTGLPQVFWDTGWEGLPMDNQMSDKLMPTEFTELWIPIEKTQEVMCAMRDHYEKNGLKATGTFCCELYAAKKNPFWMSPSNGKDVFRVDVFWFAENSGNPTKSYYPQFWELLKPFAFRAHWGKYLPAADSTTGWQYLKQGYPHWDDFLKLRQKFDPDNIFLTDYWKQHLGIP